MDPFHIVILLAAGLAGGFIAGLVGVGGGVVFSPVLFFYYTALGYPAEIVTPLTLGTSLFCTMLAAGAGTAAGVRGGLVEWRVVMICGVFSAGAVILTTTFVSTQPWYSGQIFQIVLGVVLLLVVLRMLTGKRVGAAPDWRERIRVGTPLLGGAGAAAGAVAAAAGIGGGVLLVPVYNQTMRLPLRVATATSIATIVLIAGTGVITFILNGLGSNTPFGTVGYVDLVRALVLGIPTVLTARLGVSVAGRVNVVIIRYAFAAFAGFVALRLLWNALL